MPALEQRLQRLERDLGGRQRPLEITDADRAQAAIELAAWQAAQRAAIEAWRAQHPEDRSFGHVELPDRSNSRE